MVQMDSVVQQNAATAEENASASAEMNAQSEQMKAIVAELLNMIGSSNGYKTAAERPSRHIEARSRDFSEQRP